MKMQLLISVTFFVCIAIFDADGQSLCQKHSLSSEICASHKTCFGDNDIFINELCVYREQLHWETKFKYSVISDTIFILELPGIQGNFLYTFWNKNNILSYTNETGLFECSNKPLFTKYMMKLVSEWNVNEIRKEEEKSSNMLPCELIIATKIIIEQGKYTFDCFSFKDFFDIKRDGRDFID
jgi:hypothetical protein